MSLHSRHRWFVMAAGITLAFSAISLTGNRHHAALAAVSDGLGLVLMAAATTAAIRNGFHAPKAERSFWGLMALGFALWAANQAAWTYYECLLRRDIPDPFFSDIILFFHMVPMIAAVAWRPDLAKKDSAVHLRVLNFMMLLGWWVFLYAFIVFPHQYVLSNVQLYNRCYDQLYGVENGLFLVVLGIALWNSSGNWRLLYMNFFVPAVLYTVASQFLNRAAANDSYYSGSAYDIPMIGTIAWMAATAWSAREWDLKVTQSRFDARWADVVPRIAMLAILSLPPLGLWTVLLDLSSPAVRAFRIYAVLTAMLLLGACVFLRQYVQDQKLMNLLEDSRKGFESQQKLQDQLVQKEKLASLGSLVAGAAEEIDHPLTAIMNSSEQLWSHGELTDQQTTLLRKTLTHAQRSRDLVVSLLRFAQHAPGEKALVDLSVLLNRAVQMVQWRYAGDKLRIAVSIDSELPRVWGNVNQLFQAFVEIVENAMDALQEAGAGSLQIKAQRQDQDAVVEFLDDGPGIREPLRVFDPFYTTKPVGKGTGLGLSVAYGVIIDHDGQITCQNRPEGGAVFVVRLPVSAESAALGAGAV
jgi:signal transduction histidine kinase